MSYVQSVYRKMRMAYLRHLRVKKVGSPPTRSRQFPLNNQLNHYFKFCVQSVYSQSPALNNNGYFIAIELRRVYA